MGVGCVNAGQCQHGDAGCVKKDVRCIPQMFEVPSFEEDALCAKGEQGLSLVDHLGHIRGGG